MTKLALSDEILMAVDKPSRYIGHEYNMVEKDLDTVDIRFAMCFPDVYEIGMSYLGIQILYDMFNRREDTYCERVYSPWPDLDKIMREQRIPLFSMETQSPIRDFDFLGITIQYEMCYTNILQVIDLSGIPLLSKDRTEEDPFVIGGGPCTYNPEPIADFFDMFYIGEGEESYDALLDLYKEYKNSEMTRREYLRRASSIPGIYVPQMYDVTYKEDGTIEAISPNMEGVPKEVVKVVVKDFEKAPYPMKPVVPYLRATQDRVVLEVMRGCIRGCRFCQAGMIYRPTRQKPVEMIKEYAETMLKNTGYDEISLSSLSTSDYEALPELMDYLIGHFPEQHIQVSLPSLRIDAFSLDVMKKVQDIHKVSLTFAPEAGTQRLRNVINKGLTEEDILSGVTQAFAGGWNKVKLYFMMGLPTETMEDIEGIPELCEKISEIYYDTVPREQRVGSLQITASASFFVPKPFTPFQWAPMLDRETYLSHAHHARDHFREMRNTKRLKFVFHDEDISIIEGIYARGDRRLSRLVLEVYRQGGIFDAWTEFFSMQRYRDAMEALSIDPEFYLTRPRPVDEVLPWDHINCGVSKQFLIREWENAKKEQVTPNCRANCQGCGAARFGGGVCFEG
ncbi:MAG: TIGR03960 family B12-binding radical SAM protein [Eubacterium sp.]|nr:TIGR03960 family B12-binding radical SAM protein [Eubacterium sp.]